jgi:predicted amidophosphoribosyltransferase
MTRTRVLSMWLLVSVTRNIFIVPLLIPRHIDVVFVSSSCIQMRQDYSVFCPHCTLYVTQHGTKMEEKSSKDSATATPAWTRYYPCQHRNPSSRLVGWRKELLVVLEAVLLAELLEDRSASGTAYAAAAGNGQIW